jgi:uncharacterized protein (TIGR03086 family)
MALDLAPATTRLAALLDGVTDEQLGAPTPCADTPVAGLLDHLMGLTLAFTDAAAKRVGGSASADPAALDPDWRAVLPARLTALAQAWHDPAAWQGEAQAGGVTMPAEVTGTVALDEVVVHGWDLARATGQAYDPSPRDLAAITPFLEQSASDEGTPGLFGPRRPVPEGASELDRLIALTGRDPAWTP